MLVLTRWNRCSACGARESEYVRTADSFSGLTVLAILWSQDRNVFFGNHLLEGTRSAQQRIRWGLGFETPAPIVVALQIRHIDDKAFTARSVDMHPFLPQTSSAKKRIFGAVPRLKLRVDASLRGLTSTARFLLSKQGIHPLGNKQRCRACLSDINHVIMFVPACQLAVNAGSIACAPDSSWNR